MTKTPPDMARCPWPGVDDPIYARYHDTEWGVPLVDDTRLFEKLVLEGFQAGLSWLTILKKRDNFRAAFDGFEPARVARYGDKDMRRLMADTGIVRNKLKIEAAIANAQAVLTLQKEISLCDFIWTFFETPAKSNAFHTLKDVPAQTDQSKALAKALKSRGFRFVGPTTTYAFMQSIGLVNDHLTGCPRHHPCKVLQQKRHNSGRSSKRATKQQKRR